ncbi:MAG: hypothetical protein ACKO3K_03945 [Cuspidothrix sp.]
MTLSNLTTTKNIAKIKFNTPNILKTSLYLTWFLSLITLTTTITGIQGQRQAIKTVGEDATSSIVIAQRLKDAMLGMDANVANELLLPYGQNKGAIEGYQERYEKVAERLVLAAKNINFGDKEEKPILIMQRGFGEYLTKIQQARDAHARGDINNTLIPYRAAIAVMEQKLLPAADELDKVNSEALDNTYNSQKSSVRQSLLKIVFLGLLLTAILVGTQVFLSNRTKRNINPLLLLATIINIGFLNHTVGVFFSASQNLRTAKEDAFDSMHNLRQARASIYIAHAAESHYLLDKGLAEKYEQVFYDNIDKIASFPNTRNFNIIIAEVKQNINSGNKTVNFTGFMANQLNNITFEGEKEATLQNLAALGQYVSIDQQMRQLVKGGKYQEAIVIALGNEPNKSTWAFWQLLQANNKVFDINDQEFKQAIETAQKGTQGIETTASIVLISVSLMTLFGLMPRLKEYSA